MQDGEVAIRADGVMVMFDFATDTSRPLTDDEREHWAGTSSRRRQARISSVQHLTLPPALSSSDRSTPDGS